MTRHLKRTSKLLPVIFILIAADARAQDGNRPVSMRMGPRPRQTVDLTKLMPADTAALIVAPRVASVLADLDRLNHLLSPLHPEWGPGGMTDALLARLSGRSPLSVRRDDAMKPLKALMTKDGLVDAGIDPLGQIVLAPDLDARALIVAFELVDRPQFERWLTRMAGSDLRRVTVAGEQATVVAPQSSMATTCLARRAYALCQVGVPAKGDPVSPLRRMAAQRGPRLGRSESQSTALRKALFGMPSGAHVYAVGDTKRLTPRLAKLVTEWETHANRFAEAKRRKAALAQAARLRKKIEAAFELTDAVAAGMYSVRQGMEVRWQASLTDLGRELLAWWLPPAEASDDLIARWSRTPALLRLVARVKPELIQSVAASLGWKPPQSALTGDVALLSMGLDTLSAASKRQDQSARTEDGAYWGFVFPSAVALGIRSKHDADRVQSSMSARMKPDRTVDWSNELSGYRQRPVMRPVAVSRRRLNGKYLGSPLQVQVFDRLMVVGMGPGIASAAVRRLGGLPHHRRPQRHVSNRSFIDVTLYPRAIDAAFDSGHIGPEHRQSLRAIDAWRLRWAPLMSRLREVRLAGRLDRRASRLVVVGRIVE